MIPAGFGQATFLFTGGGLPYGAACVLGFENTVPGTAQQCADAIAGIFNSNNAMTYTSNQVTLASVHVKLGPDATGPAADAAIGEAGADSDPACAPNTTWLIRKVTNLGGREGRGRLYWPGISQSNVDSDGDVGPTAQGLYQAIWDEIFDDMDTGNVPAVLLHESATTPNPLTGFQIDSRAATQRRRLRR